MTQMIRLVDSERIAFSRGWIFHCAKAEYPYENKVEFMIREDNNSPSDYAIMVISGHKAGCTLVRPPLECIIEREGIGKEWLLNNWAKWIYDPCPITDIYVYRIEVS